MIVLRPTLLEPRQVPPCKKLNLRPRAQTSEGVSSENAKEPSRRSAERVVDGLLTVTALGLANSFISSPAFAWGQTWRPRRHHRRLGEWERTLDLGKYTPVCSIESVLDSRKQSVRYEEHRLCHMLHCCFHLLSPLP